ncbi:substrate-binding domain-containing protein [Chengkuizengella axinellae]|uniref:Substrate-binding domain-containing protein n=1 Tax=Chengkuizengella axinellae TaxID=3064388 RepID=A0ABT9J5M0_9BACL|nr:substrate-binding domain-containing protein [Chengkuizengella sp. 2205SS18-9]MDP5276300.1 substrate-binding domain-containing protein [Chengkuizengella sp. 2205SS18-9]
MRNAIIIALSIGCLVTMVISAYFIINMYQDNSVLYSDLNENDLNKYRIVLISDRLGNVSWDELVAGAEFIAENNNTALDVWGTYRTNQSEVIKQIEIAIASKVDGILVQGIDHPDFTEVVDQASIKGIPVITIGSDAPDSLRRTYVGVDHYKEGIQIAEYIENTVNTPAKVCFVAGEDSINLQKMRQHGVLDTLLENDGIDLGTPYAFTDSIKSDQYEAISVLNENPNCKHIVALNSNAASQIVKTIKMRSRIDNYSIYTFENNSEIIDLLKDGVIKATLEHHPKEIGVNSMVKMLKWLEGKEIPLDKYYYTPSKVITESDL